MHGSIKNNLSSIFKAKTALVLFGLILLFFVFIWGSYKLAKFWQPSSLTGMEIAEKSALFLDAAMNQDGSFNLSYECANTIEKGSNCIPIDPGGPPHTGQILKAYFRLWKATGGAKYKEKADRAMDFVLDACVKDVRYCEWNYFALHDFQMDSKDPRYTEAMLKAADKFLSESLENTVNNNNGIKLGALYHITGDKKYLAKLEKTAQDIMDGKFSRGDIFFENDDYTVRTNDIHIIWSVYLPAYTATGKDLYLNLAKDFFAHAHITEHLDKFNSGAGLGVGNLAKALEMLLDIAEITAGRNPHHGDLKHGMRVIPTAFASHDHPEADPEIFYRQAQLIGQHLLDTRWDSPKTKKFNADYGFLHAAKKGKNYKSPFYTGWFIQSFLRMQDSGFNLAPSDAGK